MERARLHRTHLREHAGEEQVRLTENPTEGIGMGELIAGIGVVVLSILGLIGMMPGTFLSISTLVIGGAFLIGSGYIILGLARTDYEPGEMAGGMIAEFLGGVVGIVLGIFSILGLASAVLLPVATMVFGFTLLFGVAARSRLNEYDLRDLENCKTEHETILQVVNETTSASRGVLVFLGLGVFTLGLLAIVGMAPMILALIGTLSVGFGILFVSAASVFVGLRSFAGICEQPVA
jgi:hypothetical protein